MNMMNQITIFAQSAQRNRAPKTPATKTAEQEPVQSKPQTYSESPVDKSPSPCNESPNFVFWILVAAIGLLVIALIALFWENIRNFFKKRPGEQKAPKDELDETPEPTRFEQKHDVQSSSALVAPPPPKREDVSAQQQTSRSEIERLKSDVKDLESQLKKTQSELQSERQKASRNDEASIQKKIAAARQEEQEKIDKLNASHAENLRRKDEELSAARKKAQELQAQISTCIQDEKERSRKEVAALKDQHEKDLRRKDAEIETEKAKTRRAREDGEKALRDEQRAHESKLASLSAEHANETAALKDLHEKDLRRMDAEIETAKAETRSAREDGEKALREARERARRELEAAEQTHAREISAKNAEIARIEKACAEVLSRFWPDASGGNAELAPIFGGWVSEMRDAPEVSAPVMGMLSQLFAWKVAVASGSTVKDQIEALAGFSRHFFRWCEAQGKAPAEARALAAKFAEAFNASVLPEGGAAYKIFVPEVETSYFAKQMCPSTNGAKVGTVSRIETWGVADAKGGTLRRADVVLR